MIRPNAIFLDFVEDGIPFRHHASGIGREPDKVAFQSVSLLLGLPSILNSGAASKISTWWPFRTHSIPSESPANPAPTTSTLIPDAGYSIPSAKVIVSTPFLSHTTHSLLNDPMSRPIPGPPTPNPPPARPPTTRPSKSRAPAQPAGIVVGHVRGPTDTPEYPEPPRSHQKDGGGAIHTAKNFVSTITIAPRGSGAEIPRGNKRNPPRPVWRICA
jgi:hypothetical protein